MNDLFPGYFRKTSAEIKQIWKECIFALDANVLLNLYRYSPATSRQSFEVLKKLKDRLWLPWQAAREFHDNRLGVIDKQTRTYDKSIENSNRLLKDLENAREHPFVEDKLLASVRSILSELNSCLISSRDNRYKLLTSDPLLHEMSKLFQDRVGQEPDEKLLAARIERARERCANKIPPGFRDSSKEGLRPYGDVLMWFELMEHAKSCGRSVVFITDDAKNDWWLDVSGRTVGPRPELVQEFVQHSGQQVLLYRPDRFFDYASEYLNSDLTPGVIEEMREQTENRIRRRKTARFDHPGAELLDICGHLWIHRDEASKLIAGVNRLSPDDWRGVRSSFELAPDVQAAIDEPLSKCGCLGHLLLVLHEIPAPGYYAALSKIEKRSPKQAVELLSACRQLPDQAIEYVRIAQSAMN